MNVIMMTQGTPIEFRYDKKIITFGDDDLSLNLKNREMDEKVIIDICSDRNGFLVVGCETGYSYTAQVEIPAREYTQTEAEDDFGEPYINLEPVPFDIEKCTLYLWGDR